MLILGKIVFLVNCFASSLSLSLSGCCGAVGLTDWGGWRPSQLNCQQQFEIITEKREEILINKHTSHHITIMMAESLTFHILSLSPVLSGPAQDPHFKSAPVTSILLFRKHHHPPPPLPLPLIPAGRDHKALKPGGWRDKDICCKRKR